MDTPPPDDLKGNPATAFIAGGLLLATGPLGLALAWLSARGYREGIQTLAELFRDSGGFVYGVFGACFIASVSGAVVLGLALRNGRLPALAAVVPFALCSVVGMVGTQTALSSIEAAITHAAASDRATIIAASIAEVSGLQLFGAAFGVSACVLTTLGLGIALVGAPAPTRGPLALSALVTAALSVSLGGYLSSVGAVRSLFRAVAVVAPSDRMQVFVAGAAETRPWHQLATFGFVGALLLGVAGLAVFARSNRLGLLSALSALVLAVGLRGPLALADRSLLSFATPPSLSGPALVVADGGPLRSFAVVTLSQQSQAEVDERVRRVAEASRDGVLSLSLEQGLPRARLVATLRAALAVNATIEFVTLSRPQPVPEDGSPLIRMVLTLFAQTEVANRVVLREVDGPCEPCRGTATFIDGGLQVERNGEKQTWKSTDPSLANDDDEQAQLEPLATKWTDDVAQLGAGLAAARAHRAVLVLEVPAQ
ncbi:MAG: hypothetical protein U0228_09740 [Myxococcaceae bacterium]